MTQQQPVNDIGYLFIQAMHHDRPWLIIPQLRGEAAGQNPLNVVEGTNNFNIK